MDRFLQFVLWIERKRNRCWHCKDPRSISRMSSVVPSCLPKKREGRADEIHTMKHRHRVWIRKGTETSRAQWLTFPPAFAGSKFRKWKPRQVVHPSILPQSSAVRSIFLGGRGEIRGVRTLFSPPSTLLEVQSPSFSPSRVFELFDEVDKGNCQTLCSDSMSSFLSYLHMILFPNTDIYTFRFRNEQIPNLKRRSLMSYICDIGSPAWYLALRHHGIQKRDLQACVSHTSIDI